MICLQFRPDHLVLGTLPNPFLDSAISFGDPNEPSGDPHKAFVDPKGPYGDLTLPLGGPTIKFCQKYWTIITQLKTLTWMKIIPRKWGDQWNEVVDGMTIIIKRLVIIIMNLNTENNRRWGDQWNGVVDGHRSVVAYGWLLLMCCIVLRLLHLYSN